MSNHVPLTHIMRGLLALSQRNVQSATWVGQCSAMKRSFVGLFRELGPRDLLRMTHVNHAYWVSLYVVQTCQPMHLPSRKFGAAGRMVDC